MYDDCPVCGVEDLGFNMPDRRGTLYFPDDHEFEGYEITITINRIPKRCTYCDSFGDFSVEFIVNGPDGIYTVPSQDVAYYLIEDKWPDAIQDHPEDDGEPWLRYCETGVMG